MQPILRTRLYTCFSLFLAALLLVLGCMYQPQEVVTLPKARRMAGCYPAVKAIGGHQQKHLPPGNKQKHRFHQLKRPDLPATVPTKAITVRPSALIGLAFTPKLPVAYLFVYSREIAPPPKVAGCA